MDNRLIRILVGCFVIIALMAFGNLVPTNLQVAQADRVAPETAGSGRYFSSDEIFLFGTDPAGKDFYLELLFSRKEEKEKNSFIHYRFASLIYSGINKTISDSLYDESRDEVAKGILSSFTNQQASDLSSREDYSFLLEIADKQIQVKIKGLQGDFIIKNRAEFTKYLSEGNATVQVDGQSFEVHAVATKIYSSDYSKYVFFPGYNELKSTTEYLVLWDEVGNFYLLDRSRVEQDTPGYRSHIWVLFKDRAQNSMAKAFDANLFVTHKDNVPQSWDIVLPSLGRKKIHLEKVVSKDGKPGEGIAKGEIVSGDVSRKLSGLFHHHVYNQ